MPRQELRKSTQENGSKPVSDKDQIKILYLILEDAQDTRSHHLISSTLLRLKTEDDLQEAIIMVNKLVIELEAIDSKTINYLKKHGLYRILYRNPKILGEELPPNDILNKMLRNGFIGIGVSAIIILLFAATALFTVPFWILPITTGLFVGASVYLSGILYGVVNDLFASFSNVAYFLLGHQHQQTSLLRTNDKISQGIGWGVSATFALVTIAAVVFTIAATITAFIVPVATFVLPVLMLAMPLIAVRAEFYARKKAREYLESESIPVGSNSYQVIGLGYMCPTQAERAAWRANSDRNMFGFTKVPLIGLGGLIALITLSAVSSLLPPLLITSSIVAVIIPVVFAAVACVTLLAAGVYLCMKRNKHVDDRFRLEFDRNKMDPNLYLDEDHDYIQSLFVMADSTSELEIDVNPSGSNPIHYRPIIDREPKPRIDGLGQIIVDDTLRLSV